MVHSNMKLITIYLEKDLLHVADPNISLVMMLGHQYR